MPINNIYAENFTAFDELVINPSSGINIIIGKNGTGKTLFLKGIYGALEISRSTASSGMNTFMNCFRKNNSSDPIAEIWKADNKKLIFSIEDDSETKTTGIESYNITRKIKADDYANVVLQGEIKYPATPMKATYLVASDILSHSKGLLAMADMYKDFPFDKTQLDIIRKASQWQLNKLSETAKKVSDVLEQEMDGSVIYENDEFFIKKKDGRRIHFQVEAEGLKKLGVLWLMLQTGCVDKDTVLIWDEPDSNINPLFLPKLVECLLELSRNGVQIFLSTHNYIFAEYFNVKAKESDRVMYYSFTKDNNKIVCENNARFDDLKNNSISHAYENILDDIYETL